MLVIVWPAACPSSGVLVAFPEAGALELTVEGMQRAPALSLVLAASLFSFPFPHSGPLRPLSSPLPPCAFMLPASHSSVPPHLSEQLSMCCKSLRVDRNPKCEMGHLSERDPIQSSGQNSGLRTPRCSWGRELDFISSYLKTAGTKLLGCRLTGRSSLVSLLPLAGVDTTVSASGLQWSSLPDFLWPLEKAKERKALPSKNSF